MDAVTSHSFLSDILHAFAQALLWPDILLLLLFAGYALFSIGSILVEFFTERRNFKIAMPKFLASLMAAQEDEIPAIITKSGLLNRQKSDLLTVFDYRTLPGDALLALIRRLVNNEETHYDKITGRNNTAAKISPMLGLMGTLIPLGPGIEALGRNDTSALSSSLLIAFDTTVAGLIVAAICLAVGKIRSNWYNDYLSALDSGMATMLQKIEDMRAAGTITVKEPSNYAFMFDLGLKKNKDKGATKAKPETEKKIAAGAHAGPTDDPKTSSVDAEATLASPAESEAAAPVSSTPGPLPTNSPISPIDTPNQRGYHG